MPGKSLQVQFTLKSALSGGTLACGFSLKTMKTISKGKGCPNPTGNIYKQNCKSTQKEIDDVEQNQ